MGATLDEEAENLPSFLQEMCEFKIITWRQGSILWSFRNSFYFEIICFKKSC